MNILVNISVGELLDKVSVLRLKKEKIHDEDKLIEVNKELLILEKICKDNLKDFEPWIQKLKDVNKKEFEAIEGQFEKERKKQFDETFILFSRRVLLYNDFRCRIKREINEEYDSEIKEQKSDEGLFVEDL